VKTASLGILAAIIVVLIVVFSSLYEVQQTEQVLLTQFGRPVGNIITRPGLHSKLPFVQTVISFDNRLLDYSVPAEEVILNDQRRLVVDSFVRFRITNPLKYYQAVGATENAIQTRLSNIVSSSLRDVLSQETLLNVLSNQRGRIMGDIKTRVGAGMQSFGVTIEDVRIRRADLPPENTQAILSRMKSERQRAAAQARAEGYEAAAKIRADADRKRTVILADAKSAAEGLRGRGEAQAIGIYATSFGADTGFFRTWRTLQAYREGLANGNSRLVLTPGSDFLKLLRTAPTAAAVEAAPASTAPASTAPASTAPALNAPVATPR